jgi:hypothetical protein
MDRLHHAQVRAGRPRDYTPETTAVLDCLAARSPCPIPLPDWAYQLDQDDIRWYIRWDAEHGKRSRHASGRYMALFKGVVASSEQLWVHSADTLEALARLIQEQAILDYPDTIPWFPVYVVDRLFMEPIDWRFCAEVRRAGQSKAEATHCREWELPGWQAQIAREEEGRKPVLRNPSSVQVLRQAERILRSDPAELRRFLNGLDRRAVMEALGYGVVLRVTWASEFGGQGGALNEKEWEGDPGDWPAFLKTIKRPQDYEFFWEVYVDSPHARSTEGGISGEDPLTPYSASNRFLRDIGWSQNPVDRTLGEAARILASSPALMREFIERVGPRHLLEAMRIEPILVVQYEDQFSDNEEWVGPLEDWPEKVEDDGIEGEDVHHWTLVLGRRILGDWPSYSEKQDKPATFVSDDAQRRMERKIGRHDFWIPAPKDTRRKKKRKAKKKRRKKTST